MLHGLNFDVCSYYYLADLSMNWVRWATYINIINIDTAVSIQNTWLEHNITLALKLKCNYIWVRIQIGFWIWIKCNMQQVSAANDTECLWVCVWVCVCERERERMGIRRAFHTDGSHTNPCCLYAVKALKAHHHQCARRNLSFVLV